MPDRFFKGLRTEDIGYWVRLFCLFRDVLCVGLVLQLKGRLHRLPLTLTHNVPA